MIEIRTDIELKSKKAIRDFLQKENYEAFLLELLKSSSLFPENITRVEHQDNGEADYYDPCSGKKYEATLLLDNSIVSSIISNPMFLSSEEYWKLRFDELSKVIEKRLTAKVKKEVPIILFNVIPDIFHKIQGTITESTMYDNADSIIMNLKENGNCISENIILVSINYDGSFYVRTLYPRQDDLHFINEYDREKYPFKITNFSEKILNM